MLLLAFLTTRFFTFVITVYEIINHIRTVHVHVHVCMYIPNNYVVDFLLRSHKTIII